MGCGNCGSGGGGTPAGCGRNGSCVTGSCGKLDVFDWLAGMELPSNQRQNDIIEVQFKNTRKDFFENPNDLQVFKGQPVVVESPQGHDIGVVSITGELVKVQMRKKKTKRDPRESRKILRIPDQDDLDKWQEMQKREKPTMFKARNIVDELKLNMKISDVEYRADGKKATFYYTADDRVDFRELIRRLADEFKIRVEMRQIGARQEAGRIGGIGSCGRELCCSTWLTDFRSVSTNAARYQQLSINPVKLAGQCGKLKCCLNYELDSYLDALDDFPDSSTKLKTKKGTAVHQKSDIFQGRMWYFYFEEPSKFFCLSTDRVKEIIGENQNGKKPEDLSDYQIDLGPPESEQNTDYANVVGQDSLTRFDSKKKRKPKKKGRGGKGKKFHARGAKGSDRKKTDGNRNAGNERGGNSKSNPGKRN